QADRWPSGAEFAAALAATAPRRFARRAAVLVLAGVIGAGAALLVWRYVTSHARGPGPSSVAVLYFDNLSRDTADAYLADGLTEATIVRLGQLERLAVKSRDAVRRYRGSPHEDPTALGRTLGVGYLASGSVQRVGTRVGATVEFVRAA